MNINRTITSDVLVIGSGGAALRAAFEASNAAATVVVVNKGTIGTSGATVSPNSNSVAWQMADECSLVDDSPDTHARNIVEAGLGMADQHLAEILANEVVDRSHELESLGMNFIPDPMGNRRHYSGYSCFGDRPRAHGIWNSGAGHAGDVVQTIARQLAQRGVPVHNGIFVSDLVVADGQCIGALAIDPDGEAIVYRSGAVVIATGGAWQVFPPEPGRTPIDTTGDGYAMGLRAGAELTNMEFMQYMLHRVMPFGVKTPGVFWALCPDIVDAHGHRVLERYLPSGVTPEQVMSDRTLHFPFSTRDNSKWLDIAIASEIQAGNGNSDETMSLDFRRADLSSFRPSRPQHVPEDFTVPPMISDGLERIRISAHAVNGGLLIDERSETSLSGLFAAGETATGPHGADRLGGAMVSGGQVFGARAGRYATEVARGVGVTQQRFRKALQEPLDRIARFSEGGEVPPAELRETLQNLMKRHMVVVRKEGELQTLLSRIDELQCEHLPKLNKSASSALRESLEIDNLLETAKLMVESAFTRRESRGGHFRSDFPVQDDQLWNTNLVLVRGEHGLRIEKRRIGKR